MLDQRGYHTKQSPSPVEASGEFVTLSCNGHDVLIHKSRGKEYLEDIARQLWGDGRIKKTKDGWLWSVCVTKP